MSGMGKKVSVTLSIEDASYYTAMSVTKAAEFDLTEEIAAILGIQIGTAIAALHSDFPFMDECFDEIDEVRKNWEDENRESLGADEI